MKTKVVNIYKEKYDVYIGRAGKNEDGYFGNPIRLDKNTTREKVIEEYVVYFYDKLKNDEEFKQKILELKGKTLGCFCSPKLCHGDIIAAFLDSDDDFIIPLRHV